METKPLTPNKTKLYMKKSEFKTPESRADNDRGWHQELAHLMTFLDK